MKSRASLIVSRQNSWIFISPESARPARPRRSSALRSRVAAARWSATVTARISGFRRAPSHAGAGAAAHVLADALAGEFALRGLVEMLQLGRPRPRKASRPSRFPVFGQVKLMTPFAGAVESARAEIPPGRS